MNSIKNACALTASLAVMSFAIGQAQAKPIVYPSKGQSPQQQQKDEGECYVWAKNSTGIDPAAVAAAPLRHNRSSGRRRERASGALKVP
jgi:hypothetical protein